MKAKLLSSSRLKANIRDQSIQQGQRLAAHEYADKTIYEKFPMNYHNKLTNSIVMMMMVVTILENKSILRCFLFKLKQFQNSLYKKKMNS